MVVSGCGFRRLEIQEESVLQYESEGKKRPKSQLRRECVCVCVRVCVCVSCVSHFATPWTVAHQTLSVGFPRQEYWSGLLVPAPGDLPHPGMETPHWQADSFTTGTTWEAQSSRVSFFLIRRG